ncbi:CgeB family protein [Achromobacter insolitus]|uniref:CgeB family protein n=1 Tax=Achromobacter insolitus TaxID=217204 RepID=UPI002FE0C2BA
MSTTRQAYDEYVRGNYSAALNLFRKLSVELNPDYFKVNIQLCLKRLPELFSAAPLNGHGTSESDPQISSIRLLGEGVESIELNNFSPIFFRAKLPQNKRVGFFGKVSYSNVINAKHPKALVFVEYLDNNGKRIPGPFPGLSKSEKYGDYCYLMDSKGIEARLFSLSPPSNAVDAVLGFVGFHIPEGAKVLCGTEIRATIDVSTPSQVVTATNETHGVSVLGWPLPPDDGRVRVMSIFDEFSRECFAPQANLIEPRPDNATLLLERDKPELVFVESTWRGNKSTWQYRVAKYAHPPGAELAALLAECKKKGIPSVFWNKEDPVHFENFIDSACGFDYIFTTAEEAIPLYKKRTTARINALPFAAEATLHNPIGSGKRNSRVCFAGSYYANRFKERRDDQLMLLNAATSFDFDIFDRNAGAVAKDFCFPEKFSPFVRGKLPYVEMNRAYRNYRVFLNVNSVIDSNTMFSRRVFELMACGTPIVSTPSVGIDRMFGNELVWLVQNEHEAKEAIGQLLNDENEWRRRSIQGIRSIFAEHTFAHRFQQVLDTVGIRHELLPERRVLCVAEADSDAELDALVSMIQAQKLLRTQIRLIVLTNSLRLTARDGAVKVVRASGDIMKIVANSMHEWNASHVAVLDGRAHYGACYVQDMLNAFDYSGGTVVGKPLNSIDSYCYSTSLAKGSFFIERSVVERIKGRMETIGDFAQASLRLVAPDKIFASDTANFMDHSAAALIGNVAQVSKIIDV